MIYQFNEFGEFRKIIDIKKSLIIFGDYFIFENICNQIINYLKLFRDNILQLSKGYHPIMDIIRQMLNITLELKENILDGNLYSSYILLRNLCEDLARLYVLREIITNIKLVECFLYAYLTSTLYSSYKKIENKQEINKKLKCDKVQKVIDKFIQNKYGWYDLFKFQRKERVSCPQIRYNYISQLNNTLGMICNITSKVVHNNIVLPPVTCILEIKYFKHLMLLLLQCLNFIFIIFYINCSNRIWNFYTIFF